MDYYKDEYESEIIEDLDMYGEIPLQLLRKMFSHLSDAQFYKKISTLKRNGALETPANTNVRLNRRSPRKDKMIDALWVFSEFAPEVKPHLHGPLDYPAQMFFIIDEDDDCYQYDISVFKEGDMPDFRTYVNKICKRKDKLIDNTKFIFIVPNEEYVSTFLEMLVKDFKLDPSMFMVATLVRDGINIEPEVNIYAAEC